ncbi:chemotaxis protein CheD [Pontibacillus yanchengensis]|uniref:Chemotaxis protein CheD n=2 Tax=Pontibacillus yanchengensis TaxID=462910 RepID=A0ACC7VDF6_9BACI|nr:chemotaxis protein CheD [Pontibacillus yanchengensis]MYL33166.1 chemotaxis protein CheD [Pontibacillus yanchengensis]MYL51984.1 chemotaxis protein CheD [Pontibacillus yanchengensis]
MNETISIVKVGIADFNIVQAPNTIRTSGLGSCVGVVLFDSNSKFAGMAHVMLPTSTMAKETKTNIAKYADTAIPALIQVLLDKGVKKYAMKAKIAGGAQMFQFSSSSDMMRIGPRNVEAVKEQLKKVRIPLISEDCGGNSGRTIEFHPRTGVLEIRTVNKGVSHI